MKMTLLIIMISLSLSCTGKSPKRWTATAKGSVDGLPGDPQGKGNVPSGTKSEGATLTDLGIGTERKAVRLVSFPALLNKFQVVTGVDDASEAVVQAKRVSQLLGDYNFSLGIQPEYKWTSDKMDAWFQIVDLACRSKVVLDKLNASNGEKLFLESAYGRGILPGEVDMIKSLEVNSELSAEVKARIFCSSILESGEFIAQ